MFKRYIILSALFHIILILLLTYVYKKEKKPWVPPPITAKIVTKEADFPRVPDSDKTERADSEEKTKGAGQPQQPAAAAPQSESRRASPSQRPQPPSQHSAKTQPAGKPQQPKVDVKPHRSQGETEKPHAPAKTEITGSEADSAGAAKTATPSRGQKPSPPSVANLFDKDIIAKHSQITGVKQGKDRTYGAEKDTGLSFEVEDMKYEGYMRRLREMIEASWIYPPDALKRKITGDLQLSFTINKNGTLGQVYVFRTSGNRSLDDAAVQSIKDASPFWPLPNEWQMETFTIRGRFVYHIYDMDRRR
ncbi:MAG: TonB family protein [Nitrospirae bacterium YQR-1]